MIPLNLFLGGEGAEKVGTTFECMGRFATVQKGSGLENKVGLLDFFF